MSLNNDKENTIFIGYEKNVPIMLPFENKFDNTLILGSAGCGKTFRTLKPMIEQDIQHFGETIGLTVLCANSDLSNHVVNKTLQHNHEIKQAISNGTYNKETYGEYKTIIHFDYELENCPYFNPLEGNENDVINTITYAFLQIYADAPEFFKDTAKILIRNSIKVVKNLYGDDATLSDLQTVICNPEDKGLSSVLATKNLPDDVRKWFIYDYYSENTKTFENTSGIQKLFQKIMDNHNLKKALVPPKKGEDKYNEFLEFKEVCEKNNMPYKLNFDEALKNGYVVVINTANNSLRELGRFLGLLMVHRLQVAIRSRLANRNIRTPNMIYIDDFPLFSNSRICDILPLSWTLQVGIHLATTSAAQMGVGHGLNAVFMIDTILNNTKNKIVYSNSSAKDIHILSKFFELNEDDMKDKLTTGIAICRTNGKNNIITNV